MNYISIITFQKSSLHDSHGFETGFTIISPSGLHHLKWLWPKSTKTPLKWP